MWVIKRTFNTLDKDVGTKLYKSIVKGKRKLEDKLERSIYIVAYRPDKNIRMFTGERVSR